ncbi:MAG: GspE/PulE family protein [Myxococcota bacterium]
MGGGRLGSILVNLRLCTEEQIRKALSAQLEIEMVRLDEFKPDEVALGAIPRDLLLKYEAIPLRVEQDKIHVAMLDPFNLTALDDIQFATGRKLVVVSCTEGDFAAFVKEHLASQSLMQDILDGGEFYQKAVENLEGARESEVSGVDGEEDELVHDLKLAGEEAPIITLCNFLLVESINRRASDIHIEPYETYFRVRLRIDGTLQNLITPPQRLHSSIVTRMKIMADMDIAKRREPQDGHIAIRYNGETCHYRVSTLPTIYGEKCVVRLLKKDETLTSVDTLGFEPSELDKFKQSMRKPQGIVLVTGPTGSGKTTTLHAGLSMINEPGTNIVTLEDPVEASIPGINHVQINEAAGLTFPAGLRSILRQDPDVVFVGEMRDPEVAAIAVKAALTGHLVLSTLHTNSASESLLRLADMGVAGYLLANALVMIVAQRLMRRVCDECAVPYVPTAHEVAEFELSEHDVATANFRKGRGCDKCYNTGYRGRTAVYEVLRVTNDLRTLIRKDAPTEDIVACAEDDGMRLLFNGGVTKALRGETTFAEIRRTLTDAR